MAKEKTYWLGELVGSRRVGSIKVDGKLYAVGEPFPADKVDAKKLAGFKKAGRVGSVPFPIAAPEPNDARDKDMALLQGKLSGAETENTTLKADAVKSGDKIAGLELDVEAKDKELSGFKAKPAKKDQAIIDLKKLNVELDLEVKRLAAEAKEAADLKAAHVKDHAEKKGA